MSEAPKHTAFFGDGDHTFALPVEMVTELERVTATGIGGLCRRLFAGDFSYREILETIRLGLIGGGATPQIAAALVHAYGDNRPLTETYPLAVSILETLYFGRANSTGKKKRASK